MKALKIDLFSEPFEFWFEGEKDSKKKTSIGTILSYLVLILSLVYFFYLIYLYATGGIYPTITSSKVSETSSKFHLPFSPLILKISYNTTAYG
jgi:hypothetical protein